MEDTVENQARGMAAQIIADDEKRRAQELVCILCQKSCFLLTVTRKDVFNIAPKRPNWDLKRELEKKLAKLESRTQESIHILIRKFAKCLVYPTLMLYLKDNVSHPRRVNLMTFLEL